MSLIAAFALVALPPADAPAAAPADGVIYTVPYNISDLLGEGGDGWDELADRVVAAVDRDSWATFGGRGVIRPSAVTESLVVRQTRAGHEAIVAALTRWRDVPTQIQTELLLIELPAEADATAFLKAAGVGESAPAVLPDAAAVAGLVDGLADQAGYRVLSRPVMAMLSGQELFFGAGDGREGVACRVRATADGDAVKLAVSAAFDGADAPPLAGDGVRAPAGGSAVYRLAAADGTVRLVVLTPTVLPPVRDWK